MNTALLNYRFDHIFFTGSPTVGKIVMQKAARFLTPVTLELGGKSPALIDEGTNLKLAAKSIAWGKFLNAGQTCVAPDYILVKHDLQERFVEELIGAIQSMYGTDPLNNSEFPKIINDKPLHTPTTSERELSLRGQLDPKLMKIAPTILSAQPYSTLMTERYWPILPTSPSTI